MKNILIFCSANTISDKYSDPAKETVKLLCEKGYNIVWGGASVGLMNIVSTTAKLAGSNLIGITHNVFEKFNSNIADELIIAKTLSERKALMIEKCDAILGLVGGTGTLDEITEVIELKKHDFHLKPVVILDTDNFYSGFRLQLQKMEEEGFVSDINNLVHFTSTPY